MSGGSAHGTSRARPRSTPAARRAAARRRRSCLGCLGLLVAVGAATLLGMSVFNGITGLLPSPTPPNRIGTVNQPAALEWGEDAPVRGVDVSFPQCSRTLRDIDNGFAIVGLDGGMPSRKNPCFAQQWRFALRQAGSAVYVNTADPGRGSATDVGGDYGRDDVRALRAAGVPEGTPVWLDVELPQSWNGSQQRHREVITAHARALAAGGYPVGIYSAPALWDEITGDADPGMPVWVGLGNASAERAQAACDRVAFGGRRPDIVQRIGTGSDGRPLDRNLVCPGSSSDGLIRPN